MVLFNWNFYGVYMIDLQSKLFPVVVGHSSNKISPHRFKTVRAAELFVAQLEKEDPEGVHAGEYYIDAPEEMLNGS
jgi:hypothetical protein